MLEGRVVQALTGAGRHRVQRHLITPIYANAAWAGASQSGCTPTLHAWSVSLPDSAATTARPTSVMDAR